LVEVKFKYSLSSSLANSLFLLDIAFLRRFYRICDPVFTALDFANNKFLQSKAEGLASNPQPGELYNLSYLFQKHSDHNNVSIDFINRIIVFTGRLNYTSLLLHYELRHPCKKEKKLDVHSGQFHEGS
jgi:hypothetical protein